MNGGDDTPTLQAPVRPSVLPRTIGRLELAETLGEGGMGVVLAAYDRTLDRRVAVKLIRHAGSLGEAEERRRLLREARAMARLSHPNVVEVYDAGTVDGHVYLSMELVQGQTLKQWLRCRPRSWEEILDAFVRAGEGLAAAHRSALVHRDFKPSNVLVSSGGRVLVTDFGLARSTGHGESAERTDPTDLLASDDERSTGGRLTELTASGLAVGTPAYMPPEQHARGMEVDARADQYALCAALYEALYGVRPFFGTSVPDLYFAKLRCELQPPGAATRRPPRRLRRVLRRGLSPKASERWSSMEVLLDRLRSVSRARRRSWEALAAWGTAVAVALVAMLVSAAPVITEVGLEHSLPIELEPGLAEGTEPVGLELRMVEVEAMLDAARFDRAAALAAEIALEARRAELQRWRAPALSSLGRAELGRGRPATARRHLVDALHEAEARGDDDTVVRAAITLALVEATHRGRVADGMRWARHAIARLPRAAADAELRARVARAHGIVLRLDGRHHEATRVLEDGLRRVEAEGRSQGRASVLLRHALANQLADLGHDHRATALFERTLGDARALLGETHPDVARVLFDLSLVMQRFGHWEEVVRLRREALRIFEASLGPQHPVLVVALRGLGDAMLDTGRPAEGESFYLRALSVLDRGVGDEEADHPLRVQLTERIAQALAQRGELDEALVRLGRAVAMARRLDDREAEYRVRRVRLWQLRGAGRMEAFHEEADALGRDVRVRPDPLPAGQREDLSLWASSLAMRGRLIEADELLRELVEWRAGPTVEQRAGWAFARAKVLAELGRDDEARSEGRRASSWLDEGSALRAEIDAWLATP